MSRKKSFKPDYNACLGINDHENFGTFYESMAKSEAFKNLSNPAKQLYVLCRVQQKSSKGRSCLHEYARKEGIARFPDSCFVFPAKQQEEYGLTRTNTARYFKELMESGFIGLYQGNKHRYKINIYRFISDWKQKNK